MTASASPLLSLRGITKRFTQKVDLAGKIANSLGAKVRETVVQAVSEVDLDIADGEVVGLVGESGCGKSTLGRIVAGIQPASAGTMAWRGKKRDTVWFGGDAGRRRGGSGRGAEASRGQQDDDAVSALEGGGGWS